MYCKKWKKKHKYIYIDITHSKIILHCILFSIDNVINTNNQEVWIEFIINNLPIS